MTFQGTDSYTGAIKATAEGMSMTHQALRQEDRHLRQAPVTRALRGSSREFMHTPGAVLRRRHDTYRLRIDGRGAARRGESLAKVPALPRACFQSEDKFYEETQAAYYAVEKDIAKQSEINNSIKEKSDSIDPMERMRLMQEYMLSDPQRAQRILQGYQTMGENLGSRQSGTQPRRRRWRRN